MFEELINNLEKFPTCKKCYHYVSKRHQLGGFTKRCGLNIPEFEESCPKNVWKNNLQKELEERKEKWKSFFKFKYRLKENPARVTINELLGARLKKK